MWSVTDLVHFDVTASLLENYALRPILQICFENKSKHLHPPPVGFGIVAQAPSVGESLNHFPLQHIENIFKYSLSS